MHPLKVFAVVSAVTLAVSTHVRAQQSSTSPLTPPVVVTRTAMERPVPPIDNNYWQDKLFIQEVLDDCATDAAAGKIAILKGGTSQVREVGQRAIDTSARISQLLADAIAQFAIRPLEMPSKKQLALLARLDDLSGPQFDQAFLRLVVRTQKRRLGNFQLEAARGSTTLARHTAQEGVTLMRENLKWMEQIEHRDTQEIKAGE